MFTLRSKAEVPLEPSGQVCLRQINPTGNIPLNPSGKSLLQLRPSRSERGAYRDRHERGMGCGGRQGIARAMGLQGGINSVSGLGAC